MTRTYIDKDTFLYKNTYEFKDWKGDTGQEIGDRTINIDFCRTQLPCPTISQKRKYQWTLHTFGSDDNEWQAGQVTQAFDNVTLDVVAIDEKYHYMNFIPHEVEIGRAHV